MNSYFELITKWSDIKIDQIRNCKYCNEQFAIYDIEKKLYDKHSFKYCETCPLCTFKLQNIFFNDRNFYKNKDSETWENLISIIYEWYKWKIIEANRYRDLISNDLWLDYARELTEDIFKEFKNLYDGFPKPSRLIYPDLENSIYSTHSWRSKNVYLSWSVFLWSEDVYYSQRVVSHSKNVFYSFNILESTNIYNSSTVWNSYNIFHSFNVWISSDLYFCYDMYNCKDCLLCCNQVNSKYKIFNKQYDKSDFENSKKEILKKLKTVSWYKILEKEFQEFLDKNYISESLNTNRCEKTLWDSTFWSYNTINSYICAWTKDCINILTTWDCEEDKVINVFNCSESWTSCENCAWSSSFWNWIYNCFFSFWVTSNNKNIYYCYYLSSCEECMFCIWLQSKKYCILNKQYQKEKYFEIKDLLIKKLKKDNLWWEEFPYDFSIFPYNDTLSYDYFKVNKVINFSWDEEIIDKNSIWTVKILEDKFISDAILDLWGEKSLKIKWRTTQKDITIPEDYKIATSEEIENIDVVDENILSKVILCPETNNPFKIVKKELEFLKKKWLCISLYHQDFYFKNHISRRPIWKLYEAVCDNCKKDILSIYKTKPKYKVFCPECYMKKVFK